MTNIIFVRSYPEAKHLAQRQKIPKHKFMYVDAMSISKLQGLQLPHHFWKTIFVHIEIEERSQIILSRFSDVHIQKWDDIK